MKARNEPVKQHILLVEDDSAVGRSIAAGLTKGLGVAATWVATNHEAIAFMRRTIPSVIVSDLGRLHGDGEELVAHVRGSVKLRNVPVMILSGQLFMPGLGQRVFEHRIDAAYQKPQSLSTLLTAVSRLLGRAEDPDVALLRVAMESMSLDYKAELDVDDKRQRAATAKDIIAFANSGGGSIVVGVSEAGPGQFSAQGISDAQARRLEVTKLNQKLRAYLGPTLLVETRIFTVDAKVFARIAVPSISGSIAFAHTENQDAGLFLGRVYVRTDAAETVEVRDSATLSSLLDRVIEQRLSARRRSERS